MLSSAGKRCKSEMARFWTHLSLAEMSGALGDLGTFLPLLIGLVKIAGLDLGTTLLFTGLYNIITGLLFDIPMPVQPMKTIAAVALAEPGALTIPQIMAAGIFVSSCIFVLGATGLMGLVTRLIPTPIIRGMQLGLGLQLALKGWQQVWYTNSKGPPTRQAWTPEGLVLGIAAIVFIYITIYPRRKKHNEQQRSASTASLDERSTSEQAIGEKQEDSDDVEVAAPGRNKIQDKEEGEISVSIITVENQSNSTILLPLTTTATNTMTPPSDKRTSFWQKALKPLWALGDAATAAVSPPKSSNEPAPPRITCCTSSISTPLIPAALIIVILGVILTIAFSPDVLSSLVLGPSTPQIVVPSGSDWKTGILRAGLPQLPLTAFNSVLSVCQLAEQLFPSRHTARPSTVAASVGAMNLFGCWFGAMPCCHGAGGLAGQVRFGARWGTAPIFLGLIKIVLSLFFGSSLFALLQQFPGPLLGAMLVFAGMELAAVARGQVGERGVAVMLFTAAVAMAMNNVAIGVVAGLCAAYLLAARDYLVDGVYVLKNKWNIRRKRSSEGVV